MQLNRGKLLLVLAAVLWSTSGLLVKSPPLQSLDLETRGPLVACYRALVAGVCLLPFVTWRRVRWRWNMLWLLSSFASMNLMFVMAMTHTSAAVAIFLQYTSIAWAYLLSAWLLRESISRANWTALAFALPGIGVIVADQWAGSQFFGTVLALGSGLTYAGVIVALRALREEDPAWLIALCQFASGLVLLPWMAVRGLAPNLDQSAVIVALGALQMALPYLLFARALQTETAQDAGLLTLLEPILNPLWVWMLWGETVSLLTWCGGILILAGLLIKYVLFSPAAPQRVPVSTADAPSNL